MISGLNRSLIADLQRALGTTSILEWIETECSRLASFGLSNGVCVRLTKQLLDKAGIREVVSAVRINGLAAITPCDDGGFKISLKPILSKQDRRFWIAHEIAHTLWYRKGSSPPPLSNMQARYGADVTIEWLCNRAAAALLVPRVLLHDQQDSCFGQLRAGQLHLLEKCAAELDVPPRLLARRLWHDIQSERKVILAVEDLQEDRSKAVVRWAAVPDVIGREFRHRVERKTVPSQSLPRLAQAKSGDVRLIGQWRSFLSGCLFGRRATSFKGQLKINFTDSVQWCSSISVGWCCV